MAKYNDIDMKKWKDYDDIYTDSLWIINKRDSTGAHKFKYHGNYVPQIAYQLLSRYTKKGDWILDPFLGSGTTSIVAQRLGRNSIGIEIQKSVTEETKKRIDSEDSNGVESVVVNANSKIVDIRSLLNENKIDSVQFVLFHPPYWDIIKFSDEEEDISNSKDIEEFKKNFGLVIDNCCQYLENERYCAVIIGDKYSNSQITPLGFICMNLFIDRGYLLKGIVVKNFGETQGKLNAHSIWRYRALSSDYFVFQHEYILIFKKALRKEKRSKKN